ncbi:hypothetical protein THRCLA_03523 [Thraustotheca clavata]|uniref:Uncharacterized protein n=1 Tax=Thraustotheca clavata TaxID=74557 RepID=A0A1W0A1S9_9STRA|nr:hypothetical protein THRCLA_03523 [Thraustotheca clavata]
MSTNGEVDVLETIYDETIPMNSEGITPEHIAAFLRDIPDFGIQTTIPSPPPSSSTAPSSDSDTSQPKRRNKRKQYNGPKEELEYLKKKQTELTEELEKIQSKQELAPPQSIWQSRAKEQIQFAQRSIQENTRLKEMIQDQLKMIHVLDMVFKKRPKLSQFPSGDLWKQAILGTTGRESTAELLLQQQYERLDSEWIRHGLYQCIDRDEIMRKSFIQSAPNDEFIQLHSCGSFTMPIDFKSMADILWRFKTTPSPASQCEIIQTFDPDTVYVREKVKLPDPNMPMVEMRSVLRRYFETNRVVFVWRAILDDQLHPHEAGYLIGNRSGWSVLQEKSEMECFMQGYITVSTPIFPPALESYQPTPGTLTELLLEAAQEHRAKFGFALREIVDTRRELLLTEELLSLIACQSKLHNIKMATQDSISSTMEAMEMEMLEVLLDNEAMQSTSIPENSFSMNEMSTFLASTTDFGKTKTKNKRRYLEPKEEIEYLKIRFNELQERLQELKDKQAILSIENPWKARAFEQAQLTRQCMLENERLKVDIREQMQVIQALERVLQKRPRLSTFPNYQSAWKHGVLQVENREADLERILKYHYDRIDSNCIRYQMHGSRDSGEIIRKAFVETSEVENIMHFRAVNCMKMNFNFQGVADLVWDDKTKSHVIETFHSDLVYIKDYAKLPDASVPLLEARIAVRRYFEPKRVVILWCSILEDQLLPHNPKHYIDNRSGWIIINDNDENTSYLQGFVTQTTPSIPQHLDPAQPAVGTFTELILQAWETTYQESWKTTPMKTTATWLNEMHEQRQKQIEIDSSMTSSSDTNFIDFLSSPSEDNVDIEHISAFLDSTIDFREVAPTTTTVAPPKRSAKRRYKEPKEEIEYLKNKHEVLEKQLEELQARQRIVISEPWRARAVNQVQLAQRSLQENAHLKTMVESQMKLIETLQRALQKRPKLSDFPSSEVTWKQSILGLDNREADAEAIMKYQYDRLESEWIRHRLYEAMDRQEQVRKAFIESGDDGHILQFNFISGLTMDMDFIEMATTLWDDKIKDKVSTEFCYVTIITVGHSFIPYRYGLCQVRKNFTNNHQFILIREQANLPDPSMPMLESRMILRRYVESNRVVILWRSILEDKLNPHEAGHLIDNRSGWVVVHQSESKKCYLQGYVTQITPSLPTTLQPAVGTFTEVFLRAWEMALEKNREKPWLKAMREREDSDVLSCSDLSLDDVEDFAAFLQNTTDLCDPTKLQQVDKTTKNKRRQRIAPKAELEYLRLKHRELKTQLETIETQQLIGRTKPGTTIWQSRAFEEAQDVRRSLHENARLKQRLQHQIDVIQSLEKAYQKQQKFSLTLQRSILGKTNRREHLEELMLEQYNRLETEWIRYKMYDVTEMQEPFQKVYTQSRSMDDAIELSFCASMIMPIDYTCMTKILWEHMNGNVIESFHQDLVYIREELPLPPPMPPVEARSGVRKYKEDDKVVIVWSSIHEDSLYPHQPGRLISNREGWVVIQSRSNNECHFQGVIRVLSPVFPEELQSIQPPPGTLTEILLQATQEHRQRFSEKIMEKVQTHAKKTKPAHVIEIFHQDLVHIPEELVLPAPVPPLEVRCGARKYKEENRVVMIWSSIYEDDSLYPHPAGKLISSREGCMNELGGIEILDIFNEDAVSIESMSNFLATTSDFNAHVSDFGLDFQPFLPTTPLTSSPSPSATTSVEASSSDSEELVTKRPMKKRHRERPKQEIEYLKVKHDELMEQLRSLQKTQTISLASPWKARAMNQAQSVQRSLQENNRLKTMSLTSFHPNLVYTQEEVVLPDESMPILESRDGIRRYVEPERVVLLWRSILEDHLIPHNESSMISNRWGWMVMQYKSPLECYVQGYVLTTTPIFPVNAKQPTVGTLTELLIRVCQENKEKFGASMEKAVHEAQAKLGVLQEDRFVFTDQMCQFNENEKATVSCPSSQIM